jgi:TIR domain/WD domain, G-beta repeat
MPTISISYRRADSEAMTGRIFDRLAAHYGREAIFRDIDNIPPGIDFRVHINDMLRKTNILLAVIGPNWLGARSGTSDRIQEESDAVRVEIETALRRRTPLIPILIGTTTMPSTDQLPPSLKDFAFRNAVRVDTGQDFDYHMDRLIRSMDSILSVPQKSPPSGETRIPGKTDTGSRQAAIDPAGKPTTGSRAALLDVPGSGKTSKERAITVPIPEISAQTLWPADRQGQLVRLGIAGAAALAVFAVIFGFFLRGSGGDQDRVLILPGHTGPVSTVAFSANGALVAGGSSDKSVIVWDAGNGSVLHTLTDEVESANAIGFLPNTRRLISGGRDGIITIRDIDTGQRLSPLMRPEMSYNFGQSLPPVLSLAVSADGTRVVAGNADQTIKIWNTATGAMVHMLPGHNDAVTAVVYSPDGKTIVSGSIDGTVRTWDADTGQQLRILRGKPGQQILAVAVSPDGRRIAAAGSGDTVTIWSTQDFQARSVSTQLSAVDALAFARDSRRLAVGGSDSSIQMWDTDALQMLPALAGHSGNIRALVYSPDGRRLASGSDDKTVALWPGN